MKLNCRKPGFFAFALIVLQIIFLSSCKTNSKQHSGKIGFLGFYLDMEYTKVKSTLDSLLKIGDLHYFETTDLLGTKQKNLYNNISIIGPFLYAKVNLRGSDIIDQRLTSIQLTLCSRLKTSPGPKGRLIMDKIYFWEMGDYIIFFDFGYPESFTNSVNPPAKSEIHELNDSTSAPIIYYDFTQDYIDRLLDKASRIKDNPKVEIN